MTARHPEADTSPVTVERSDAIDAVAGLLALARDSRKLASSRRYGGPRNAQLRADLRARADVYDAAARRLQAATEAQS